MADDEVERADGPDEPRPQGDSGGLSPEDVAYRSFTAAKRGVSEKEVREFLREVAGELAAAVGRERDLLAQIHELEDRLADPPPPTKEQTLDYLGEETVRVLRSAQEAADEIRSKASARAQAIVERAEEEAARVREAANSVLSERSREAEVASTVTLREAEDQAQAVLRLAARDAGAEIEGARQRGREMVGEARAVRERILADLGKRRSSLQDELGQLQATRAKLLKSARAVRRQLTDAVQALTPFEEQQLEDALEKLAPNETVEHGPDEVEEEAGEKSVAVGPALELLEKPEVAPPVAEEQEEPEEQEQQAQEQEEDEPDMPEFVTPEPEVPDFVAPAVGVEPEHPKVDELFARIRAGREEAVGEAGAVLAPAQDEEEEPAEQEQAEVPSTDDEAELRGSGDRPEGPAPASPVEDGPAPEGARPGEEGDVGLLSRRDEVLAPVSQELLRRCKRALQDEQNELLDRLRRERGRTSAEQLLAPLSAQVTDWADVLEPAVDEAYGAGRGSQSADEQHTESAPRRLVSGLAEILVTPLREHLVSTLDSAEGDVGPELEAELSTRVGARYREWRAQELEYRVGDVLATAYARGVYDAAPEGSQLRWVPAQVGQCPDADDNALEPTTRGSNFPTGQPFPPAHPGCRCLIAVAAPDDMNHSRPL